MDEGKTSLLGISDLVSRQCKAVSSENNVSIHTPHILVCTLVPTLDILSTSSVHSPHIHLCYTSCLIYFKLEV